MGFNPAKLQKKNHPETQPNESISLKANQRLITNHG